MRILLVNPPDELDSVLGVGKEFVQKYEPLGLLYIAAVVREKGCPVSVIDAYAENTGLDGLKKRISSDNPDIIGISTLTCNGANVFSLGRWIKKNMPKTLVVLGNIHASVYARAYLENNCCDIVVHGEGEVPFLKIIDYHGGKCRIGDIPAISWINGHGNVVQTSPAAVVENLPALPLPARDLLDQKLYRLTNISNQSFIPGENRVAKTMITSRGCPNRCIFCTQHHGRGIRFNDAVSVADEMEILEKEYNAAYVYIMDPLFMADKSRVLGICSEIKRRKLRMLWGSDAHVNHITPELVKEMDGAGCYELSLGIESGNQGSLDVLKKGIRISQIIKAVNTIKDNSNISIEGLFILGLPGETYRDSLETIRFAKSLPLDMAQFSILTPYPGSPLFDELAANKELDTGIREDGSIDTSVWRRYASYICFTDIEPIWITGTLSLKELRNLQKRALREFYIRPSQIVRNLKRLRPGNIVNSIKIVIKGFF